MSKAPKHPIESVGAKDELLSCAHSLRQKFLYASRLVCMGNRGVLGVVVLLTVVAIDVLWPVPALARAGGSALVLFLFIWAAIGARGSRRARNMSPAQAVGIAETTSGLSDGQGRIAVDLAAEADARDPLNETLRQRAYERGLASVRLLDLSTAVDMSQARFALLRLGAILTLAALVAVLAPHMIRAEAPRLFFPMGDHPPYSRTRFDLEAAPAEVRIGDDVVVSVKVTGKAVDLLTLGLESMDGVLIDRIAMKRMHDDSDIDGDVFEIMIRDLGQPVRVYAESSTSWSRWKLIAPAPKPRLRSASVTITPPAYTGLDAVTLLLPMSEAPEVLVGSIVELRAVCSMEIDHVEAAGSLTTTVDHAAVMVRWRIDTPGESMLTLDAVSAAGFGLDEPVGVVIQSGVDQLPTIAVVSPVESVLDGRAPDVYASVDASVSIVAIAHDDVAVQDVRIEWSPYEPATGIADAQSWAALPTSVYAEREGLSAQATLTAENLGKAPGQSIWVKVSATDNRSTEYGGEQIATAGPIAIHFVTNERLGQLAAGDAHGAIVLQSDGGSPETAGGESQMSGSATQRRGEPTDSADENAESSSSDKSQKTAQPSSESSGGSSSDSRHGQLGEQGSSVSPKQVEDRSPSAGVIRALRWGAGAQQAAPFMLKPNQLRNLSERHRQLASRYYLLLNRQAAAASNRKQSGTQP